MGRRALALGEHGEIDAVPQRLEWVEKAQGDGTVKRTRNWTKCAPRSAERWRARCYARGHDGVRREVARFGPKKAEAVKALEDALSQRRAEGDVTLTAQTPLTRAGEFWLTQMGRRESGKSDETLKVYRAMWDRHVLADGSSLRGLTLAQTNDPQRLRGFLQRLADTSGTGSAKTCKSVLSGILTYAVENGVLASNTMRQVRPVKSETETTSERNHTRALTRTERDALIAHADETTSQAIDPRSVRKWGSIADLLAYMAGTGVRIGEAAGLRWDHLDLEAGIVRVHGTKSAKALRTLDLPGWLTDRLRARADRMGTHGLVFPSPTHTGEPEAIWERRNIDRAVRETLDGAGLAWAIAHSLRRTTASLLHEGGAPLVRIADQLGHADPALTARVYLGRDPQGSKRDLAELL